nr:DinB family protein [Paenibacillus donghaensis]
MSGWSDGPADEAGQPQQPLCDYQLRLAAHAHWANTEILRALQGTGGTSAKLTTLFGHLLSAERVWLERLNHRDSSAIAIWPVSSLAECEALLKANYAGYQQYLSALSDSRLPDIVSYQNSKGIAYSSSVADILSHVALHGSYHRGQISTYLRLEGQEPVNTDFINYARLED